MCITIKYTVKNFRNFKLDPIIFTQLQGENLFEKD